MSSRSIVIIITLIVVGFTAISLKNYIYHKPKSATPVEAAPRILVAKRNLGSGSFVQAAQDLDWKQAPKDIPEVDLNKYQFENTVKIDSFAGAVVRRSIHAGEPISASDLMKSGDGGFLSAVLGKNMRAVSIAVTATSGNAGFISPGDRVDLLLTHRVQVGGKESGSNDEIITETFARNVRVLAIDQMLENPDNKAILAKTITVEVSPKQAEQISVAAEMGKISMSLVNAAVIAEAESLKNEAKSDDEKNTAIGTDQEDLPQNSPLTGISKVKVIRGDKAETVEFYQEAK